MHAHGAMVGTMIGQAATVGLRRIARAPTLSGVLADFLQQILEVDRSRSADGNVKGQTVRAVKTSDGGPIALGPGMATLRRILVCDSKIPSLTERYMSKGRS